jgi:hypothetical protein
MGIQIPEADTNDTTGGKAQTIFSKSRDKGLSCRATIIYSQDLVSAETTIDYDLIINRLDNGQLVHHTKGSFGPLTENDAAGKYVWTPDILRKCSPGLHTFRAIATVRGSTDLFAHSENFFSVVLD